MGGLEGEEGQEGGEQKGGKKEEGGHGIVTLKGGAQLAAAVERGITTTYSSSGTENAPQGGSTSRGSMGGSIVEARAEGRQVIFEGGCSGKFKASVAAFLEQRIDAVEKARLRLGLPLDRLIVGRGEREEVAERIVRQGKKRDEGGAGAGAGGAGDGVKVEERERTNVPVQAWARKVKDEPVTSADDVMVVNVASGKGDRGGNFVEASKVERQEHDCKVMEGKTEERRGGGEGVKEEAGGECERLEGSVAEKIARNVAGITARQLKVRVTASVNGGRWCSALASQK